MARQARLAQKVAIAVVLHANEAGFGDELWIAETRGALIGGWIIDRWPMSVGDASASPPFRPVSVLSLVLYWDEVWLPWTDCTIQDTPIRLVMAREEIGPSFEIPLSARPARA